MTYVTGVEFANDTFRVLDLGKCHPPSSVESTTTTPTTITKVDTVTGKVFHVVPPLSVTLTLEDGTNQEFKIPEGQKFDVDGQMVDAFGLREGMKISATKVTETPETIVTQKAKVTGKMPPPPPPNVPILIVFVH